MPLSVILLASACGVLAIGLSIGLIAVIIDDWRSGHKVDALFKTGLLLFALISVAAIILAAVGL